MPDDVIVAVFESPSRASAAARELVEAGVPGRAIQQLDQQHPAYGGETTTAPPPTQSFWAMLFGTDEGAESDHETFEDSVQRGGTVLSVTSPTGMHERVMDILEAHEPVDLDDHSRSLAARSTMSTGVRAAGTADMRENQSALADGARGEEVIQLAEEQLQVGKRMVETGRTRVRRYVVETPVEERVRLRTERVVIERRRPVTGDTLSPDAFTDTVTEVTERGETPVVQKTARVGEEVVVRTDASEREETVHDTVRRQDVEITRNGEKEKTTRVGPGAMPGTAAGPRAGGPETPVPGRTGTPT